MYSKKQSTALEAMCREQAALAGNEMELSLVKYWLAEAEEWKQLATAAADVVLARTVSAPPSGRHPLGRAQVDRLSRLTAEDLERLKLENDRSARACGGAGSADCPG
jgi:hypothetical protein